jgi:hypothetical protein
MRRQRSSMWQNPEGYRTAREQSLSYRQIDPGGGDGMSRLTDAAQQLLARLKDTDDGSVVGAAAQEVIRLGSLTAAPDRGAALRLLAAGLATPQPMSGGIVAITGGSLVEQGTATDGFAVPLLRHLAPILSEVCRFADWIEAEFPQPPEKDASDDGSQPGFRYGARLVPQEIVARAVEVHPVGINAYQALGFWCLPSIACLSPDKALRKQVRADRPDLLVHTTRLADVSGEAAFLERMLHVLDDEPLLVLYPETQRGFLCRISGIAENFQLQTLLMDRLIGPGKLVGTRPDPRAVAVADGSGPQEMRSVPSKGVWNLYNWFALQRDGTLPAGKDPSMFPKLIWGEGRPSDIAPFEGLRIVLLGPPSVSRGWNTGRLFGGLRASLEVEHVLPPSAVRQWLERLKAAAPPTP